MILPISSNFYKELIMNIRVGSHEISLLLLSLGPVLERTLLEVDSSDSLGNDLGSESGTTCQLVC
jgi:hypothetical protein